MLDADKPIIKSAQDRLGRTMFAKYLARCILDHVNPESLVIGLQGGWGTGKTSLINLILEELRYAASNMFDNEKPIILNFSAWSYSGQQQLIYSFFRRLSSELRRFPYLENSARIIHLLELYVSFFTHQPVPKSLRPKHSWLSRWFNPRLTEQETYGWESGRDLTLIKAELNELLRRQKHKIIIIIDNISRLKADEVDQIFQIVKSMGDYANTVYLLAYDELQVIHVINQVHSSKEGKEFLEKIIQLPFDVPPITKNDLESLLFDRLKYILRHVPEEMWNSHYWANIYYTTLKHFFKNCRDITRYVNTLSFSYPRIKELVNPVDFFALTAIEVFEPKIYYGIRDNKDLFTDLMDNVFLLDKDTLKEEKLRCDEILQQSEKISRDILLQLLLHLFPRLYHIYTPEMSYHHSTAIARKNLRICSPDMFDVYFRLSMPTGQIRSSEMNAILALAADEEGFTQALLRLNQDDRITTFLDLLDGEMLKNIPQKNIAHVINALIDSGDLFPEGETTLLDFNTAMRIHRIVHQILRRFDTTEERFELLQTAIQKATNSLYIIIHEIRAQAEEHNENEDTYLPLEHRDLTHAQLIALQKLAVNKIKFWENIGRLSEHPKLLPLLQAWQAWGHEGECENYVVALVREDRGLLAFLGAALKEPVEQTMTKLEIKPEWKDYIPIIENFIPTSALEPRAKAMFENQAFEQLREKEQLALMIFLDLIKAKTVKIIPKTTV